MEKSKKIEVYQLGMDLIPRVKNAALTIGTFDGVHVGHQQILNRLVDREKPTVVTFDPHPQQILKNKAKKISIITPIVEKVRKLEKLGIERVIVIPFNIEFASITAERFLHEILIDSIGMNKLVVGYNHSFGRNREGDIEFLAKKSEECNFELEIIDAHTLSGVAISSTKIRNALHDGQLDIANDYLGSPYRIIGNVVKGNSRGRELGYPTANIEPIDPAQLIPAEGVYSVRVHADGKIYAGAGSIGTNLTFTDDEKIRIEVHLIDTEIDLYGKTIIVEWLEFLRKQEKYSSREDLIKQLKIDVENVRNSVVC